jgi:hypothetical protein
LASDLFHLDVDGTRPRLPLWLDLSRSKVRLDRKSASSIAGLANCRLLGIHPRTPRDFAKLQHRPATVQRSGERGIVSDEKCG